MLHDLPTDDQDPDDPVTLINTDIKAAFQECADRPPLTQSRASHERPDTHLDLLKLDKLLYMLPHVSKNIPGVHVAQCPPHLRSHGLREPQHKPERIHTCPMLLILSDHYLKENPS
jgi:hypothetical protein